MTHLGSSTAGRATTTLLGPRPGPYLPIGCVLDAEAEPRPRGPVTAQGAVDVAPVGADKVGERIDGEASSFEVGGKGLWSTEHARSVSPSVYRVKGGVDP